MAEIVLGIGASHTPMLNASVADWQRYVELDLKRDLLTREGDPTTFDALVQTADADMAEKISAGAMAKRHARVMQNVKTLEKAVLEARLDTLIVVGDDQQELYHDGNMPCMLIYRGATIPNVPLPAKTRGPDWARPMIARYYETERPKDYPVDSALAHHLIDSLIEQEFDVSCSDSVAAGEGEGHAFAFVHNRLLKGHDIPVVPVCLNTYYPPNQATPRRCYRFGQAIAAAVRSYKKDMRVGILASGGLSHFTIDEELDSGVLDALKNKDAEYLQSLPARKLQAGSSEIRNWICIAGALEPLPVTWMDYQPGYRSLAGTGTGMGFVTWN